VRILSIGDGIREGSFRLHSRFRRALNFLDRDRLVSVVNEGLGAGPLTLVASGPFPREAAVLKVRDGSLLLGDRELDLSGVPVYRSLLDPAPVPRCALEARLDTLKARLLEKAPPKSLVFLLSPPSPYPLPEGERDEQGSGRFRPGFETAFACRAEDAVREMLEGDLALGAGRLKGCGFGLTPSGDDYLAGMLFGLHLRMRAGLGDLSESVETVHAAALGASLFSNTLLGSARRGLFFEEIKLLAEALLEGGEDRIERAAEGLLSVGHSSGADLAAGFVTAAMKGEALCSSKVV